MSLDPAVWGGLFSGPPQPNAPLPLVGYRYCRLGRIDRAPSPTEEGPELLWSLNAGQGWDWRLNSFHCSRGHHLPQWTCGCGLYACRDLITLRRIVGHVEGDVVLCGVRASGRVLVFEGGWRAQYARIVAISTEIPRTVYRNKQGVLRAITGNVEVERERLQAVAKTYGVPLVTLGQVKDAVDISKED